METKTFTFSAFNEYCSLGIANALEEINEKKDLPVIVCVGSDLVLGDSLGPLVGTLLKNRNIRAYIYGTLNMPITAKEVEYAHKYLHQMHPNSISIAVDAAVGEENDVGLIKVINKGLKPGLGVGKILNVIGDVSIVGVVAPRSVKNYNLYNLTRLNLVYRLAEKIANGIERYLLSYDKSFNVSAS